VDVLRRRKGQRGVIQEEEEDLVAMGLLVQRMTHEVDDVQG
jgi:hypothetical protein